ncbi:MAG: DUF5659 domain-containing protein [Bryobacteraceae bacterium]
MNNKYETTDLYLSTFLSCKGYECEVTSRERGQCAFKFISDDNLKQAISDYYNNASIPVLDFKNKLRDKKSEIINISRQD